MGKPKKIFIFKKKRFFFCKKKMSRLTKRVRDEYYNSWNDFRIMMPYGCDYDPATKSLQFFNRNYTYVGCKTNKWRETPESCLENGHYRRVYFYNDGSKPLQSEENMQSYLNALSKFKEWTELPNTDGFPISSVEIYESFLSQYSVVPLRYQKAIRL